MSQEEYHRQLMLAAVLDFPDEISIDLRRDPVWGVKFAAWQEQNKCMHCLIGLSKLILAHRAADSKALATANTLGDAYQIEFEKVNFYASAVANRVEIIEAGGCTQD